MCERIAWTGTREATAGFPFRVSLEFGVGFSAIRKSYFLGNLLAGGLTDSDHLPQCIWPVPGAIGGQNPEVTEPGAPWHGEPCRGHIFEGYRELSEICLGDP